MSTEPKTVARVDLEALILAKVLEFADDGASHINFGALLDDDPRIILPGEHETQVTVGAAARAVAEARGQRPAPDRLSLRMVVRA